jgi:hypothetical protein
MSALFIACGFVLSKEFFGAHWIDYSAVLAAFGFPFVTMYNLFSFMMSPCFASNP